MVFFVIAILEPSTTERVKVDNNKAALLHQALADSSEQKGQSAQPRVNKLIYPFTDHQMCAMIVFLMRVTFQTLQSCQCFARFVPQSGKTFLTMFMCKIKVEVLYLKESEQYFPSAKHVFSL